MMRTVVLSCLVLADARGAMTTAGTGARAYRRTGAPAHRRTPQPLGPGSMNADEAEHLARPRRGWWNHRGNLTRGFTIRSATLPSQGLAGWLAGWCARGGT